LETIIVGSEDIGEARHRRRTFSSTLRYNYNIMLTNVRYIIFILWVRGPGVGLDADRRITEFILRYVLYFVSTSRRIHHWLARVIGL